MSSKLARIMLFAGGVLLAATARPGVAQSPSADPAADTAAQKVVMYATDWCPYCARARAHFRRNGIDYVEYDIEKSASARAEHKRLGGRGVPLILIGEQRMDGFSETRFDALYAPSRR
jgi:glutaredoxin